MTKTRDLYIESPKTKLYERKSASMDVQVFTMNQITFVGRLTDEPRVTYLEGSEPLAHAVFNFAVPDTCMKRDEQGNYPTDFFRCSCWNKLAEIVEKHCSKGSKLILTGRCKNNNYEKDGKKIYGTEILVDSLEFLESKKQDG